MNKLTLAGTLSCFIIGVIAQPSIAAPGLLFNVSASGTQGNVNINLCLNGKGPLSCQNFTVSALNLMIRTTIPGRVYPVAGIKINTPGYSLANTAHCTMNPNGYCLFSVSQNLPQQFTLTPSLGSSIGGGVVACLGGAPYLNLIAATNDSINGIPWGGLGTLSKAQSPVNGAYNSRQIINSGVTSSAVNLCKGTINGYNDWFLPAKNQLNCLYTNRRVIPNLMNAIYWSSTEDDNNHAWMQFFDNGNQLSVLKTFYSSVRCVRPL